MTQQHVPSAGHPEQGAGASAGDREDPAAVSPFERFSAVPEDQGLYHAEDEKDACGLAVVATLDGVASHDIVDAALTALRNLEHRGAVGGDEGTGTAPGCSPRFRTRSCERSWTSRCPPRGPTPWEPRSCPRVAAT